MRPLLLIAFLALVVYLQINGEKIPVNDGAYADAVFYRDVAKFFLDDIEASKYDLLQLTRILPFALLNLSFSAFHIVKDNAGLGKGMLIWQVVYLAVAVYWYFRICTKIRAKLPLMTLGFVLMFCNFAWLKWFWYQPFSPEPAAFALGMGQINYFLRYEKYKLGMVSVIGAFVSPLLVLSGLLMLFLPGDKLLQYPAQRPKSAFPLLLVLGVPILVALLGWGFWDWKSERILGQTLRGLALAAYVPLGIWVARKNPIDWEASLLMLKKKSRPDRISKGFMSLAGLILVLVLLSGSTGSAGLLAAFRQVGVGTFRFPWDFLLDFGLQWGMGILLTAVFFPRFVEQLGDQGWAVVLVLLSAALLLPFVSAAVWAAWVPMWLVVLLKALKQYHLGDRDVVLILALALILSLFWLPINSPELVVWLASPSQESTVNVQRLALHLRGYASPLVYVLALSGFAAMVAWLVQRKKSYQRTMR